MPYLNWKTASLKQEVGSHNHREFKLELELGMDQIQEVVPYLEEVFAQGGSEFRLDLPREWILFWKVRDGESRVLLAHPQEDEWVATVALEAAHGVRLIEGLKGLQANGQVSIEGFGTVGSMSNVDIVIKLKNS